MKRRGPKVTEAEVEQLVDLLNAAPDNRMLASELAERMFGRSTEALKRRVRAIASAAGTGVLSNPGSSGYFLWWRCSVDELHACLSAWDQQIKVMSQRRDAIRIRLHQEHPATFEDSSPELRPSREQLSFL